MAPAGAGSRPAKAYFMITVEPGPPRALFKAAAQALLKLSGRLCSKSQTASAPAVLLDGWLFQVLGQCVHAQYSMLNTCMGNY